MPDLPTIRARWSRITNQSIGEAQNTIEELCDTLEAALRVPWMQPIIPSLCAHHVNSPNSTIAEHTGQEGRCESCWREYKRGFDEGWENGATHD